VLTRNRFLIALLLVCLAVSAYAQYEAATPGTQFSIVPLTVDQGVPLQVMVTQRLRYKLNEPVHGRLIESVFAFDREVVPVGTEIEGRITGFKSGGKLKRLTTMFGGDFTPVREPLITFDTIVLEDGTRIPVQTAVTAGATTVIEFSDGTRERKQDADGSVPKPPGVKALTDATAHAGSDVLKGMLWNLVPYHPQFVPTGVRYRATLLQPLDFGTAILGAGALNGIGSAPGNGSTVYARLQTPLNSHTTKVGESVRALLIRPLFSSNHLLIFPVGSRLTGEVVQVHRAGKFHRPGEMAFKFTKIEPPVSILSAMRPPQEIDGRLMGMQVSSEMNLAHINKDGGLKIQESKARFFSPALAAAGFGLGLNATAQSFPNAFVGAYSGSMINRLLTGDAGLGMPAGIAGRMIPPAGIGLGLYSVGYSLFVNVISKGPEVNLPVDTPVEVRFDRSQ
jgi:hypothetical protein